MPESVCALIMAAGKGTRMETAQPKVLHMLAEKPLLYHVLDNVRNAGITDIYIVVGHKADDVKKDLDDVQIPITGGHGQGGLSGVVDGSDLCPRFQE